MRTQPVRVAIDLETTGLHPEQDAVIEIGALKFAGDDVVETFESFVAPGMSVPYRVQRLTGITSAQLVGAPTMADLLPRLRAFLGDLPLVGHSVPFDAAFLRRYGLAKRNPLVDTFELASTLLPNLSSYTLASVGGVLGVSSPVYHRALADAQLSRDVFLALIARLAELDASTIEALGGLAAPQDWTPSYFIRSAVRAQRAVSGTHQVSSFASLASTTLGAQLANKLGMDPRVLSLAITPQSPVGLSTPLLSAPPRSAIATSEASESIDLFSSSVSVAAEEQVHTLLAERVGACFVSGGVLLAEAQNDVASLSAALSPVLKLAKEQGQRVLVSVADGESMSRLVQHVLLGALDRAGLTPADVPLAELSEHESYLCLHRWFGVAREARDGALPLDVARGLAKLTVWAGKTESGVRSEVSLNGQEMTAWERTRSGAEFADTVGGCTYRRDGYCFVARAQQAAERALLVVTTHATLAAHLSGADRMLPDIARTLIFDAHLLEEELRRVQSVALDRPELLARLSALAEVEGNGARAGLLHLAAERMVREGGRAAHDAQNRERSWFAQVERARQSVEHFFAALRAVLLEARGESADAALGNESPEHRTLRIDASTRQLEAWREAVQSWGSLDERLASVVKMVRDVAQQTVATRGHQSTAASDGIATDLLALARLLDQTRRQGTALMDGSSAGGEDFVSWLRIPYAQPGGSTHSINEFQPARAESSASGAARQQRQSQGSRRQRRSDEHVAGSGQAEGPEVPTLQCAPVQVGALLKPLYTADRTLALVGPTLAVGGDFSFTCGVLALPEQTQTFGPQLDRTEQTLLCLPTDVPEPNAPQYQRHLDDALVRLAVALEGRTVAIFPSHAALRAGAVGIKRALERHNILVLAQGQDGSARQLWQTFRTEPRVVLLGAGTFWEGAEQPDMPPACVVVTRIPFPALSDPLLAARSDMWTDRQSQFVVPHAALRLRQALGGLAWSHWRRNVVVIFDRRVQTRDYGSTILSTLARCTTYQERLEQIVERATEWVM